MPTEHVNCQQVHFTSIKIICVTNVIPQKKKKKIKISKENPFLSSILET